MDNEYKVRLINSRLFKKTYSSSHEYRGRCPFCGHTGNKFYIRIDLDSDDPVMYNCFHCPAQGYLNYKLLERLGLEDQITLPKEIKRMKKLPVDTVVDSVQFVSVTDNDNIDNVCNYINKLVGHNPSIQDLLSFQYIGNPSLYCSEYIGMDNIDALRDDRIWFKMVNANMIGLSITNNDYRKYISARVREGSLYQMKTMIDMYQDLNIIIADNITDVIGLYYNFDDIENCMYIATCGKQYQRAMRHVLNKGIFGKGVNIHIFKNRNIKYEKIFIDNTMRKLFGKVSIYENTEVDSYSVMKDCLHIQRVDKR